MAERLSKLSTKSVLNKRKPGWYGDGRNLWLKVDPSGSRSWVFRYTINGRARMMGLGPFPECSLSEARSRAHNARSILKHPDNPRDPLEVRREQRAAQRLDQFKAVSFDDVAREYIAANRAGWSNEKHANQWSRSLETYASPMIGKLAVRDIDTGDVVRVLDPIWRTKTETASRVRQRIERILDYATTRGMRKGQNPARWRGHLDTLLPKPSKVSTVTNHAALPHAEIGSFIAALRRLDGIAARGLELLILTATRTSEVIGATWGEFDLDARLWIIPPERMKASKEHRVPLSDRALEVLRELEAHRVDLPNHPQWILPGPNPKKSLSNNAFLSTLRKRLHRADVTAHGFRSTFRDWAGEETAFPREVIEHAMAHQLKDKAEAAYQRGDLLRKRAKLMQAWADRCAADDRRSATITSLSHAAS